MHFCEIEKGFQHAFVSALRAYRRGSTAIGCAIMNADGELVSSGENSIYANDDSESINRHHLAHAEINAILKIGSGHYGTDTRNNTVYTTMEPCIMCFGAIVMCYYKRVKFAARDPIGGATKANNLLGYNVSVEGPHECLEDLQVALAIYRSLTNRLGHVQMVQDRYNATCKTGVDLGVRLYHDAVFGEMIHQTCSVADEEVFDYMLARLEG